MNLRTRVVLIAALLGTSAASAGVNTWSYVGPDGGDVIKVVYNRDTPTTIYLIASGGFFRSADAGTTWQHIKGDYFNIPTDLEVDPTDSKRIYVISNSPQPLQVSSDGGLTLSPVTSFPAVIGSSTQVEVSADGNTLYANSSERIFRSTDRGDTWEERSGSATLPGIPQRMVIDPTDKNTLYAIAGASIAELFVTHDGAATWTQLTAAAPVGYLYDITLSAANPARLWIAGEHGVYVSSNSGLNFSANFSPPTYVAGSLLAINPADSTNLFLAAPYGHVYRTINEGASWVDVTGNVAAGQASTIAISPPPSSQVFIGGAGGLSLSTAGGTTWTRREAGLASSHVTGLSANPTTDRIYMSVSGGGVHYLSGGGSTTTPVDNAQLQQLAQIPSSLYVPALVAQEGTPGRLFASLDTYIAVSLDGGSNWARTNYNNPTLPARQARTLVGSPGNPQVLLAGVNSSLYRTADGGDTWAAAITGFPANSGVQVVTFSPSDPLVAYAAPRIIPTLGISQSFGVYRSANAGLSWSPANNGIEAAGIGAIAVHPSDAQTVYVAVGSKLWKSTNGGGSWTELSAYQSVSWQSPLAIAIDPLHPQIVYAASAYVVVRSIDGGASWEVLRNQQALPFFLPATLLPDPRRPHVLLVATQSAGAQQMIIAPDLALEVDATSRTVPTAVPLTYRYTVQNVGPFHATGVKLTLQLPASAQGVTLDTSAGVCTAPGTAITCSLDTVRAGFSATVTLHATPAANGPFQISATAQGDQADAATGNNTQTLNNTVAPQSDLSVTATGPASAQVGNALSYKLTVSNSGPNPATAVQAIYQVAAGLTPGTVSTTSGTCTVNGALITCDLGDLVVAATATVTINATAAAAGSQVSMATVTTTAADTVTTNDSASATTTVTEPPPPSPPATPPATPPSNGGGGGGSLSASWCLLLGLVIAFRELRRRGRLSWRLPLDRPRSFGPDRNCQ